MDLFVIIAYRKAIFSRGMIEKFGLSDRKVR